MPDTKRHIVTFTGKGPKQRTLPTTPLLEEIARQIMRPEPDAPIVCQLAGRWGERWPIPGYLIRHAWIQAAKKAGLRGIHPHDFRRTSATALYRKTHDIAGMQEALGHTSVTSTM